MRIFKTPSFGKDCRKTEVGDDDLAIAATEIAAGVLDAELGGYLYKKRIARKGEGKSGGYRAIVALRIEDRLIFMHLFPKSEKANIDKSEKEALKVLAKAYMKLTSAQLDQAVAAGALAELVPKAESTKEVK